VLPGLALWLMSVPMIRGVSAVADILGGNLGFMVLSVLAALFLSIGRETFPSFLEAGPSIGDTVTDQKTWVQCNERIPPARECFAFTGLD
jgi:hypothetical protein